MHSKSCLGQAFTETLNQAMLARRPLPTPPKPSLSQGSNIRKCTLGLGNAMRRTQEELLIWMMKPPIVLLARIVCPAHLVRQWHEELEGQGALDTEARFFDGLVFAASRVIAVYDCIVSEQCDETCCIVSSFLC